MTDIPPRQTYCIISPVRDEASLMRRTLECVVNQTVPPDLWVVVDDGSSDATPEILADYAARYPFIRVLRREDRGRRAVGPGVVEAFNAGYATIDAAQFDVLGKLDMDLVLPPDYFERLLALMAADPRLGSVSGKSYIPGPLNAEGRFDGELMSEKVGDDVSLGMTKLWRRACFEDMGGLRPQFMWDVLDCYIARSLGWKVYSTDDPALRFIHLRPMGTSGEGIVAGRLRWGRGHWISGSDPLFVLASCAYRACVRPFVIGGVLILAGYLQAAVQREARRLDPAFRAHLRRYQRATLRWGKAGAVRRFEEAGAPLWHARHG